MTTDGGLATLLRAHFKHWHFQRIETGAIGAGVPDLNYCGLKIGEGWLELETCKGWRLEIRPEQNAWIQQRIRAGGRVHILARRTNAAGPRKGTAADELWVWCGCKVEALMISKLSLVLPLAVWRGGPAAWGWSELPSILTTRCNH